MTPLAPPPTPIPYNHRSRPSDRAPLPYRQAELPEASEYVPAGWTRSTARVQTASAQALLIGLDTDSAHIATFFRQNWPQDARAAERHDGHIIFRRTRATEDGSAAPEVPAILISPDARRAQITGCEYYTKIKTTLRALCSALAPPDEIFLHGCTLDVDGVGLMICGESGAGKSTLAHAIMDRAGAAARLLNDDWGSLSLVDFAAAYTGEDRLHMKYRTVSSMRPELTLSPGRYASEDFAGNVEDTDARLMIPRADVFGAHRIVTATRVRRVLFISRGDPSAPFARPLSPEDAHLLTPQGSEASAVRSHYLDATTLLDHPHVGSRQTLRRRRLLASGRCVAINSHGDPAAVAERVLQEVLGSSGRRDRRTSPIALETAP